MLKRKMKFDSFNDGVLYFGEYIESYDLNNNACDEKEFSVKGKLFFDYKSIREQDKLKYDHTGLRVSIKLKTHFSPVISSGSVVKINDILYSIAYLEPNDSHQKLYIFLTELINDMDKHISIYSKAGSQSVLSDDEWNHYRTVWGEIKAINTVKTVEKSENERLSNKFKKKFIIRYIEELDLTLDKMATIKYKIVFKNKQYNILAINNVEEKDEIFEIEGVIE
ncbi:MAG: head-tail adaptor protein [Clostridium sp.]